MHQAKKTKKWSGKVTRNSHALALENGVFKKKSPRNIASSLKLSAERSRARKRSPFQSAMSMLNFYLNRAGKSLPRVARQRLEKARVELRRLFRRPSPASH